VSKPTEHPEEIASLVRVGQQFESSEQGIVTRTWLLVKRTSGRFGSSSAAVPVPASSATLRLSRSGEYRGKQDGAERCLMVDALTGAVNLKLDPQNNSERLGERLRETMGFRLYGETPLPYASRVNMPTLTAQLPRDFLIHDERGTATGNL